jgi:hypothetical protein
LRLDTAHDARADHGEFLLRALLRNWLRDLPLVGLLDKRTLTEDALVHALDLALGLLGLLVASSGWTRSSALTRGGGTIAARGCGDISGGRARWVGAGGRVVDELGAGESVGVSRIVDVGVHDAWVSVAVATGEGDYFVSRREVSRGDFWSTELDLCTGRIELGTTNRHAQLHGDELVTDEVFTSGEILGESDAKSLVHLSSEVGHVPATSIFLAAKLANLEELGIGRVKVGTSTATARGHISHNGASVVDPRTTLTIPPGEGHGRAGVGVGDKCGLLGIVTAVQIGIVGTLDWVDIVDSANDVLAIIPIWVWSRVVGTIDENACLIDKVVVRGDELIGIV